MQRQRIAWFTVQLMHPWQQERAHLPEAVQSFEPDSAKCSQEEGPNERLKEGRGIIL